MHAVYIVMSNCPLLFLFLKLNYCIRDYKNKLNTIFDMSIHVKTLRIQN